jgi:hypothetical protein
MKLWFFLAVLMVGCSSSSGNGGTASKSSAADPFGNSTGAANGGAAGKGIVRTDGVGESCTEEGATRACCDTGRQKCTGTVEFRMWGECLGPDGKPITCSTGGPNDCSTDEFSQVCDGGTPPPPPPPSCDDNEFGPNCQHDAGMPELCTDEDINNEPEILVGYSPAMGESVAENAQIKVWINDERPELIAEGEQIDPNTGEITTPGDRTAKADDGYLWEPALYIAPQTAESGGTPHFPQYIKGWYNNAARPSGGIRGGRRGTIDGVEVPGMDPVPPGQRLTEDYSTEVIWDVNALGLAPGTYIGEFVIHDGDHDRAIGCVTIMITN